MQTLRNALSHVTTFERERNKGQKKQLLSTAIGRGRKALLVRTEKPSMQVKRSGVGEGVTL